MNRKSLRFFKDMSLTSNSPGSVKLAANSDFSDMDASFILKYANEATEILDLGSGTGLVVNKLYDKVNRITAVEPFENFTKFIVQTHKIAIINKTFAHFKTTKKFDLITLFGVMHYLDESEAFGVYSKYFGNLKDGGRLIVKNQFGVETDVNVSGFSEEQQKEYYAQYRHIKKEVNILYDIGFQHVEVFDIYPPECNRWQNTHFFAIVADK